MTRQKRLDERARKGRAPTLPAPVLGSQPPAYRPPRQNGYGVHSELTPTHAPIGCPVAPFGVLVWSRGPVVPSGSRLAPCLVPSPA